jgi:hypothetical protein
MARRGTMIRRQRVLPFAIAAIVAICALSLTATANNEERISVSPAQVTAGTYQHVRFEFTAGSSGIDVGGGIRLELPVAYLETEPYFWDRPQIDLPKARGYVKGSSNGVAQIKTKVYGASP